MSVVLTDRYCNVQCGEMSCRKTPAMSPIHSHTLFPIITVMLADIKSTDVYLRLYLGPYQLAFRPFREIHVVV